MRSFSAKSSVANSQTFVKIGLLEERFSRGMPVQLLIAALPKREPKPRKQTVSEWIRGTLNAAIETQSLRASHFDSAPLEYQEVAPSSKERANTTTQ
jgi:hypothetical protein